MIRELRFAFSGYLSRATELRSRLVELLGSSEDPILQELVAHVPELKSAEHSTAPPLSLAFVGQYNAGKSTIISALTKRRDIPIDSDVSTDTVTAYDWGGIQLLDTPGIHAGYREHDQRTYRAIDRADLVVFVITSELFDDVIGEHFRKLAFEESKAQEILLVVNKMGQDPGNADTKRLDLEKVTRPLPIERFGTVFIDALSFVEALDETDAEDRAELFDIARFGDFLFSLNGFVADRGLMGRLTTPLFGIRSVAGQAKAYLDVDMPEERAALELLDRKQGLFVSSRARLRGTLNGLAAAAASDLGAYGDEVAESIEPGSTEDVVKERHENAQRSARTRSERLYTDTKSAVENELRDLQRQLGVLRDGVLGRELRGQIESALRRSEYRRHGSSGSADWHAPKGVGPSDWRSRLNRVGGVADELGRFAMKWTTGPFAQGARIGSATAARGSQAHQVVYHVGKFFGHSFKPWGAVNAARAIGNAGRAIAAVGGVLVVIAQVAEDRQKEKLRLQLRDARDSVRQEYRNAVRVIEEEFWSRFDRFSKELYENEIAAIDASRLEIVGQRDARTGASRMLSEVQSEARQLITDIQRKIPHRVVGEDTEEIQ